MTTRVDSLRRPPLLDCEALLRSLGLFDQVANKPKLDERSLNRFAARELSFDWVHMGQSELTLRDLLQTLRLHEALLPPRTGHIGNWSNIVHGRAGARDYNSLTTCSGGIGYPLLFDFNQTEGGAPGQGDWSYMPGSIVERSERQKLPLFTWDGSAFARRDRSDPLFTPFVMTEHEGEVMPLTRLHRLRCESLLQVDFRFQSDLLLQHREQVERILHVLLNAARRDENPDALLRRLFDRIACRDGRVARTHLVRRGSGFQMGEVRYDSAKQLIEHSRFPIVAAGRPQAFGESIQDYPDQMPLMSAPLFVLLLAVLNSHFPNVEEPPPQLTRPCNPHLHWGGLPMAGYPPRDRGYFFESTRHLRKLFRPVIEEVPEISPVFLVLLPAGVFNLCPHETFPRDIQLMADLLSAVRRESDALLGKPADMSRRIEATVEAWQARVADDLSPYLIGRFAPRPGVILSLPEPVTGGLLLLPEFLDLTIQQASMTMGALSRAVWQTPAAQHVCGAAEDSRSRAGL